MMKNIDVKGNVILGAACGMVVGGIFMILNKGCEKALKSYDDNVLRTDKHELDELNRQLHNMENNLVIEE